MPTFTLPFASPHATLARAGGKGLNLAALTQAGFPVPAGFIVTTEAYRAFVSANQIQARILALARTLIPDDPLALEAASTEIATLFGAGHIPADLADSISTAYLELAASPPLPRSPAAFPVAVRSSATAEDLPGLSFAGQQDTYLNIIGLEAVLDAVKRCWASLWTARALGYRARNQIAPDDVTLAVVVQPMILSEASGVLFTANPLTGRRDEMVIDASFGLGEAIVQGIVEPDHYAIDATRWTITTRKLGAKALAILPRAEGGVDEVKRAAATEQALPDAQIIALAQLAGRVAAHYGAPQDIEWAWADGQLYLLQSRPITSLYPVPEVPIPAGAVGVFFSVASIQGVNEPLTPVGREALRLLVGSLLPRVFHLNVDLRHALVEAGERLYLNFTAIAGHPTLRHGMLVALARADPAARQIILRLIAEGRLPLTAGPHPPPLFFLPVMPRVVPGIIAAQIAPAATLKRRLAISENYYQRARAEAEAARARGASLADRLALMENTLARGFENLFLPLIPAILPAIAFVSVVDRWLVAWSGTPPGAGLLLLRGLVGNVTTEMNLKLWATAQALRADAPSRSIFQSQSIPDLIAAYQRHALPAAAQSAIEKFLEEYGMRAVAEIDLARPRWRDDPASVFQTLQSYLELTDPEAAPDAVFRRGAEEAERFAAAAIARARGGPWGAVRAGLLRFFIGRIRALAGARETPKFYIIKVFDAFRALLLDSAHQLVADNQLTHADDIFFVPLDVLKRFANGETVNLKDVAAAHRAEYERELGRRQIPRLLLSTGEAFYGGLTDATAGPNDLVGEAVSPGVVEGMVRVVLDPRGTRLNPGEILVCPATDPGWTPLFLAAGGLVMEIGGMVTHGSVVAREYGIPAVVGVEACTTRLHTGQRVRVDGSTGRVTIL